MKTPGDFILSEIGDMQQVVHAACLVESAVRGKPADPHDLAVQLRAAEIILSGVGEQMRAAATKRDGARA
jgi:hypothetical protein